MLIVGILFTSILIVRAVLFKPKTPRTAAEKAIFDAETAVRKDPRNVEKRADLGAAYAMAGSYGKAINELNTALKLDPKFTRTYYLLGIVYRLRGDFGNAAKYLERAVGFEGEYADFYSKSYYELGQVYYLQKRYNKAAKAFEQARANSPLASDIIFELAKAYEKAGKKEEAINAYWQTVQYDPENKNAVEALKRLNAKEALKDLGIELEDVKEESKK